MNDKLLKRIGKLDKKQSVELAIYAAEQVIDIYEKKYPDDSIPREVIETAKKWLTDPSEDNRRAAADAAAYADDAATVAVAYAYAAADDAFHDAAYAYAAAADAAHAVAADDVVAAASVVAGKKKFEEKIEKWLEERNV